MTNYSELRNGDRVRVTSPCCGVREGTEGTVRWSGRGGDDKRFVASVGSTEHYIDDSGFNGGLRVDKIEAEAAPFAVGDRVRLGADRYGIVDAEGEFFTITSVNGDSIGLRSVLTGTRGYGVRAHHIEHAPLEGEGVDQEIVVGRSYRLLPGACTNRGTDDSPNLTGFVQTRWKEGRDSVRVTRILFNGDVAIQDESIHATFDTQNVHKSFLAPLSGTTARAASGPLQVGDRVIARSNRADGGRWDRLVGRTGRYDGPTGTDRYTSSDTGYVIFDGETRRQVGWIANIERVDGDIVAAPVPVRTPVDKPVTQNVSDVWESGNEIEFTVTGTLNGDDEFVVGCKSPDLVDVMKIAQKLERSDGSYSLTARAIIEGSYITVGESTTISMGEMREYGRDYKVISEMITPEPVAPVVPEIRFLVDLTDQERALLRSLIGRSNGTGNFDAGALYRKLAGTTATFPTFTSTIPAYGINF